MRGLRSHSRLELLLVSFRAVGSHRRAEGEALRAELGMELLPRERHRNRSAGPGARRERTHRGRHAIVAEIIKKDTACAHVLGHLDDESLGAIPRHPETNLLGKILGGQPCDFLSLRFFERRDDMQAFAACRLAKAHQAKSLQPLPNFLCSSHYVTKFDIGARIEIEY